MTKRVLVSYLAIAAIVLLVLEIPLGIFFQQRESERLAVALERDANAMASLYGESLEDSSQLKATAASNYAKRTGARVVIVDTRGISVVDTGEASDRNLSTRPEIASALKGDRVTGVRHSETLDTELLYVAIPVASGGEVHGAIRLTVDTADVRESITRFWWGLAGVAGVVLAAMTLIGTVLARSVTRPLRDLEATATRFATGNLTTTPPDAHAPSEIVELQTAMNAMAHRLDRLLTEHRAFVADASHQLRTPLTALRLRLDNLQSAATDPLQTEDIAAVVEETERLSALVNDLLRLAGAEKRVTLEPCDLVQLARDRVDTWSAVAEAAGATLSFTAPDAPLVVLAAPAAVEQILDNLIDNAIAASAPNGRVDVGIRAGQASHTLVVADNGPGMSDELKQRALERFWRADQGRPGSGLGLPIAKALAEASGGSLVLTDAAGGGLIVQVTFNASGVPASLPPRP